MSLDAPATPPIVVSPFEAKLLRILRGCVGHLPTEQMHNLLKKESQPGQKCLSAGALHLVKDTLSKGIVLYCVRAGGWKKQRFLAATTAQSGRLWERYSTEQLSLHFSKSFLELFLWITANSPTKGKKPVITRTVQWTAGDHFFLYLLFEQLHERAEMLQWALQQPGIADNPFCWLAWPNYFATNKMAMPEFAPLFEPNRVWMLEVLQSQLAERWYQLEQQKGHITDWVRMQQVGQTQQNVLKAYLQAAQQANRLDLSRFLLEAFGKILVEPIPLPTFWTGGLQSSTPATLQERLSVLRLALGSMHTAHDWLLEMTRTARSIGYLDDEYPMAQFWLAEWDRYDGERIVTLAQRVLQQIEPLRVGG